MRFPTKLCYFKKWHFLCERATYSNDQIEENEIHERKNAFRKGHSASVRKELKFASTLRNAAVNALFLKDLCFMVSVSFHNPYSNSASINCQISRNWDELGWGGGGRGKGSPSGFRSPGATFARTPVRFHVRHDQTVYSLHFLQHQTMQICSLPAST